MLLVGSPNHRRAYASTLVDAASLESSATRGEPLQSFRILRADCHCVRRAQLWAQSHNPQNAAEV